MAAMVTVITLPLHEQGLKFGVSPPFFLFLFLLFPCRDCA